MRTLIFALTMATLAVAALVVPGTIWFGAIGAAIATSVWLYASLRDADLAPGGEPAEIGDDMGRNIGSDG